MRYQKLYFVIQLAESIIDDTWVCHTTFPLECLLRAWTNIDCHEPAIIAM